MFATNATAASEPTPRRICNEVQPHCKQFSFSFSLSHRVQMNGAAFGLRAHMGGPPIHVIPASSPVIPAKAGIHCSRRFLPPTGSELLEYVQIVSNILFLEEVPQLICGLRGPFLSQEVACVEGLAPYVVRVLAPDRLYVVGLLHDTAPAPEGQKGTFHFAALVQICLVVDEIYRCRGPVVLAARVDRGGVEAALVLGQGFGVESLQGGAPAA